jgi:hypothetical protein
MRSTELPPRIKCLGTIEKISGDDKTSFLSELANQVMVVPFAVHEDHFLKNTAWISVPKIVSNSCGILLMRNVG